MHFFSFVFMLHVINICILIQLCIIFFLHVRYRVEKEEYENYIADLEARATQNVQEITDLREELKRLRNINQSHDSTCADDVGTLYKEENRELAILLTNEKKNVEQLEEKLANIEIQCQELENLLKVKQYKYM